MAFVASSISILSFDEFKKDEFALASYLDEESHFLSAGECDLSFSRCTSTDLHDGDTWS